MSRSYLVVCTLALLFLSCGLMVGQTDRVYEVTYYDNNILQHRPATGTLYILNPGLTGSPISGGDGGVFNPPPPMAPVLPGGPIMTFEGILCANVYVFDDTQEMVECCSCPLTANGPLIIPIEELTDNPLTITPYRGVIKIVSTIPNPLCDPTDLSQPVPELRSFVTHLQNASITGVVNPFYTLTEEEAALAPLSVYEQNDLAQICSFVRYLGTGRGRCDEVCTAQAELP
jgi:hypothetical protein